MQYPDAFLQPLNRRYTHTRCGFRRIRCIGKRKNSDICREVFKAYSDMKGNAIWKRRAGVAAVLAAAAWSSCAAQTLVRDGMEVSPEVYSFGEQDGRVEVLRGEFVLRNVGDDPLRVEEVVPGCHCVSVEWSGESVARGDSCVIAFAYHKDMYTKSFRKDIRVMTSRCGEPLTLTLCGEFVENEASLAQKYPYAHGPLGLEEETVSLGKIYAGGSKTEIVKLVNRGTEDVEVEIGECPEGVSAVMAERRVGALGEGFLRVKVKAGKEWGWNEFSVRPVVNGETVEPIRFRVMTVPDFRNADAKMQNEGPYPLLHSSTVYLEVGRGKKDVCAALEFENAGGRTMDVLSVQILDGRFSVEWPKMVEPGAAGKVSISLDASGLVPGRYSAKLYMVTDSPAAPVSEADVVYIIR